MDTEKQRYCVEKRFWNTRGIGWSNMLKENCGDKHTQPPRQRGPRPSEPPATSPQGTSPPLPAPPSPPPGPGLTMAAARGPAALRAGPLSRRTGRGSPPPRAAPWPRPSWVRAEGGEDGQSGSASDVAAGGCSGLPAPSRCGAARRRARGFVGVVLTARRECCPQQRWRQRRPKSGTVLPADPLLSLASCARRDAFSPISLASNANGSDASPNPR